MCVRAYVHVRVNVCVLAAARDKSRLGLSGKAPGLKGRQPCPVWESSEEQGTQTGDKLLKC